MSLHGIMVSIIAILGNFIQAKSNSSPFDTNPRTTTAFFAVLLVYALSLAATTVIIGVPDVPPPADIRTTQATSSYVLAMIKASVFSGSLAAILLLLIVVPALGQASLALWSLCLLKVTLYDIFREVIFELVAKLSQAIHRQFHGDGVKESQDDQCPV